MAAIAPEGFDGDQGLARLVWRKLHRDGYSLEQFQEYMLQEGDLEFTLEELIDFVRETKEIGDIYLQSLSADGDCDEDAAINGAGKRSDLLKQHHELSRDIFIERGTRFDHTAIVAYFKTQVKGTKSWEQCLAIEAMAKEGISEDEIRRTMAGHGISPVRKNTQEEYTNPQQCASSASTLLVEAVLMGEKRNYYRAMAMKFAKIPVEAIYQHMCVVEGADPDLIAALLNINNDSDSEEDGEAQQEREQDVVKVFQKRNYRGYRAVRQTVHLEKAKHMKQVGVSDGAIRQRLVKENVSKHIIDDLFSQFERSETRAARDRERQISGNSNTKNVTFEDDRNDSSSYDDDSDSDSDVEEEQDSSARLRTAVFRKVKSMVLRGKPDEEIKNELVAMKGVDPTLVSFFLDTQHQHPQSQQETQSNMDAILLKVPPIPDTQIEKQLQQQTEWVNIPASAAEAFPLKAPPRGINAKRQLLVGKIHFLKTLGVSRDVIVNRLHTCGISPPFVRSVLSAQPQPAT